MHGAAKKKSITPAGLTALRVLLLLIVTLFLPQTRVWGFENSGRVASGVFAAAAPVATWENDAGWRYDVPDCSVAAETIASSGGVSVAGDVSIALSRRQNTLLDALSTSNSSTLVNKSGVSLSDLSTLTARTGDEFGMFTLGGRRMVYRGSSTNLGLSESQIYQHALEGWRFSGHTHPGISLRVLGASPGDRNVLQLFQEMGTQGRSSILNSSGDFQLFSPSVFDDMFGF